MNNSSNRFRVDTDSPALAEVFKGTVAPVLSRLKVIWINTVESGEVPLVVYRIYISSVNL